METYNCLKLNRLADVFIKNLNETSNILQQYEKYINNINYETDSVFLWEYTNCLITRLPINIQASIIEQYLFNSNQTVSIIDITKGIYYWDNYFNIHKNKYLTNPYESKIKELLKYYKLKRKYSLDAKHFSLLFIIESINDILKRKIYTISEIDNILIGLLISNTNIWDAKKIINKLLKRGICLEDSFDLLDLIFRKYSRIGINTNDVFGEIVDIVYASINEESNNYNEIINEDEEELLLNEDDDVEMLS